MSFSGSRHAGHVDHPLPPGWPWRLALPAVSAPARPDLGASLLGAQEQRQGGGGRLDQQHHQRDGQDPHQ